MKILLKNARIIKMDNTSVFNGDILINDNRIEKLSENIENAAVDKIINCNGNILLPGFKNAHAHSAMTFLRGGGKELTLQDWLFTYCFPREDKLIPSDVYYSAKVGFLEYIQGGITASLDQYFFPLETARAAEEMGFRVVLHGTFNPYTSEEDLVRLFNLYNNNKNSLVTYQIGLHAEYTSDPESEKVIGNVLKKLKAPFFVHISETEREVKECYEKHGVSPVKYFDNIHFFDYGGGGYHCNYFSNEDIEIFKNKNVSIITNPGSNDYLKSGVCPIKKYLDLGFDVAIGTDGPASNYDLDMFSEMRLIAKNNPDISCYDILKMATVNGAKAMRINDCDILSAGKLADIIMIDSSIISDEDVFSSIVRKATKESIKMTMINGKVLYMENKFFFDESIYSIYKNCENVKIRIDKEMN